MPGWNEWIVTIYPPVSLRSIVLSAVRGEKRHLIRCGMQIDLDIDEDISVSTDEKWVEFILKQIFSNSIKISKRGGGEDTNPDRRGNNAEIPDHRGQWARNS